eukprot:2463049-Pleurochrysis_carterae.AAC.1
MSQTGDCEINIEGDCDAGVKLRGGRTQPWPEQWQKRQPHTAILQQGGQVLAKNTGSAHDSNGFGNAAQVRSWKEPRLLDPRIVLAPADLFVFGHVRALDVRNELHLRAAAERRSREARVKAGEAMVADTTHGM